jgi:hypothetical protein
VGSGRSCRELLALLGHLERRAVRCHREDRAGRAGLAGQGHRCLRPCRQLRADQLGRGHLGDRAVLVGLVVGEGRATAETIKFIIRFSDDSFRVLRSSVFCIFAFIICTSRKETYSAGLSVGSLLSGTSGGSGWAGGSSWAGWAVVSIAAVAAWVSGTAIGSGGSGWSSGAAGGFARALWWHGQELLVN